MKEINGGEKQSIIGLQSEAKQNSPISSETDTDTEDSDCTDRTSPLGQMSHFECLSKFDSKSGDMITDDNRT